MLAGEPPDGASSLDEARLWTRRNARAGVRCPCCVGVVKVYERHVTRVAAQGLVLMWRYAEEMAGSAGWVAIGRFFEHMHARGAIEGKKSGGDYAKPRFFGLIEPKIVGEPEDGGARVSGEGGKWAVTPLGAEFVQGRATIPWTAYVCMNELIGVDDRQVGIADILGSARHDELLRVPVPWDEWGGSVWGGP